MCSGNDPNTFHFCYSREGSLSWLAQPGQAWPLGCQRVKMEKWKVGKLNRTREGKWNTVHEIYSSRKNIPGEVLRGIILQKKILLKTFLQAVLISAGTRIFSGQILLISYF